jgi:hypothetical protein
MFISAELQPVRRVAAAELGAIVTVGAHIQNFAYSQFDTRSRIIAMICMAMRACLTALRLRLV